MLAEIRNNFEYYHLQNDFYHKNRMKKISVIFLNAFSTSACFVLFELIFLLRLISLLSKPVFVSKCACANIAAKFYVVSLLNSGVVTYLS